MAIEIQIIGTSTEQLTDTHFHVYPNPVRGNVNVQVSNASMRNAYLEIISAAGIICARYPISERKNIISLHLLSEGLYFLRMIMDNTVVSSQPLMVKREG
jgi:hypothetical protein